MFLNNRVFEIIQMEKPTNKYFSGVVPYIKKNGVIKYYYGYKNGIVLDKIKAKRKGQKINLEEVTTLFKENGSFKEGYYKNVINLVNVREYYHTKQIKKHEVSLIKFDDNPKYVPQHMRKIKYVDHDNGREKEKQLLQYMVKGRIDGQDIYARSSFVGCANEYSDDNQTNIRTAKKEAWQNFYALLDGHHHQLRGGQAFNKTGDSNGGMQYFDTLTDDDIQIEEGWVYFKRF